ncbi:MAG: hypothetical protein SWO11_07955 [Thermodesulfobacteriota bacterium]|nr:hypothetical protein [Thermodesulfobacteriota bacterium]
MAPTTIMGQVTTTQGRGPVWNILRIQVLPLENSKTLTRSIEINCLYEYFGGRKNE